MRKVKTFAARLARLIKQFNNLKKMKKEIVEALKWRYAVQVFDSSKKIKDEDLKTILEAGRLTPSSYGIEAWKFLVVENPEVRAKLREAGYGQPKISEASHLIVLARRTDMKENISQERIDRTAQTFKVEASSLSGFKEVIDGAISSRTAEALDSWAAKQVYIPLGTMIETASLLEIDSAPMEGFDPQKYDEILGLKEKNLSATVLLALGYRGEDEAAARPKVRREFEDVVEFLK
jgi:nitroreductase